MRTKIIKKVLLDTSNKAFWASSGKPSYVLLTVDYFNKTIDYEVVGGTMPAFESLVSLLLNDRDVVKLMKEYINGKGRKYPCRLRARQGMSGCIDFDLCIPRSPRGIEPGPSSLALFKEGKQYKKAFSMRITCAWKIETEDSPIYIGDLVDLFRMMASPKHNVEYNSTMFYSYQFNNWHEYLDYIKNSPKKFKYLPLKEDRHLGDVFYPDPEYPDTLDEEEEDI